MTSKNFEELTVEEVGEWLVSVRLNNAFAEEFAEQQLDGSCLMDAEEDDFDRSGEPILILSSIHERSLMQMCILCTDFLKARNMHWKKLWCVKYCTQPMVVHEPACLSSTHINHPK